MNTFILKRKGTVLSLPDIQSSPHYLIFGDVQGTTLHHYQQLLDPHPHPHTRITILPTTHPLQSTLKAHPTAIPCYLTRGALDQTQFTTLSQLNQTINLRRVKWGSTGFYLELKDRHDQAIGGQYYYQKMRVMYEKVCGGCGGLKGVIVEFVICRQYFDGGVWEQIPLHEILDSSNLLFTQPTQTLKEQQPKHHQQVTKTIIISQTIQTQTITRLSYKTLINEHFQPKTIQKNQASTQSTVTVVSCSQQTRQGIEQDRIKKQVALLKSQFKGLSGGLAQEISKMKADNVEDQKKRLITLQSENIRLKKQNQRCWAAMEQLQAQLLDYQLEKQLQKEKFNRTARKESFLKTQTIHKQRIPPQRSLLKEITNFQVIKN